MSRAQHDNEDQNSALIPAQPEAGPDSQDLTINMILPVECMNTQQATHHCSTNPMKQEDNINLIKQQPAPVTSAHKDNNGLNSPVVEHHQTSGDAKFSHVELGNPISRHVSYSPNTNNMEQDNTNLPVQKQASSSAKAKEEDTQPPLGMPHYHFPYSDGRFDYEEKYAPDPLGEEMRDNARVFKVYLDEANNFDDDMLRGFRETIDSLLIFAALFSGVITSFLIATITSLQPDYSQITAILLVEQVQLLRVAPIKHTQRNINAQAAPVERGYAVHTSLIRSCVILVYA